MFKMRNVLIFSLLIYMKCKDLHLMGNIRKMQQKSKSFYSENISIKTA